MGYSYDDYGYQNEVIEHLVNLFESVMSFHNNEQMFCELWTKEKRNGTLQRVYHSFLMCQNREEYGKDGLQNRK